MCVHWLAARYTRWYTCISSSKEDISSEAHFKSGHFHIQVYRVSFWCSSFMTNRSASRFIWVIQDSFMSELFSPSAFRLYLHRRCEEGTFQFSNATRICYFICLWMFFQSDRGRETWSAHLSSRRCTTSVYWIAEFWVVTGYVTYKKRIRFVNSKRRKQIYRCIFSECDSIFFYKYYKYILYKYIIE